MEDQNINQNPTNLANASIQHPSGFFKFLVIALTATIICLGAIFYIKRSLILSTPAKFVSMRVDNQEGDWKIYTNEKYGFQFKYPASGVDLMIGCAGEDLCFRDDPSSVDLLKIIPRKTFPQLFHIEAVLESLYNRQPQFKKITTMSLEEFANQVWLYQSSDVDLPVTPIDADVLGNQEIYSFVAGRGWSLPHFGSLFSDGSKKKIFITQINGIKFVGYFDIDKEKRLVEKILSTFKTTPSQLELVSLIKPTFQFDDDVNIEYYTPYLDVKKTLLEKGYLIILSNNPSAGEFPEIGNCGAGVDAICNVDFKKGDIRKHLNVGMSDQRAYANVVKKYPNPYWLVIGNE